MLGDEPKKLLTWNTVEENSHELGAACRSLGLEIARIKCPQDLVSKYNVYGVIYRIAIAGLPPV